MRSRSTVSACLLILLAILLSTDVVLPPPESTAASPTAKFRGFVANRIDRGYFNFLGIVFGVWVDEVLQTSDSRIHVGVVVNVIRRSSSPSLNIGDRIEVYGSIVTDNLGELDIGVSVYPESDPSQYIIFTGNRIVSKWALVVGIYDYGNWLTCNVEGAVPNAQKVYDLLVNKLAFNAQNVRSRYDGSGQVDDTNGMKQTILDDLEWLRQTAQPGDIVVFYMAGHGSYASAAQESIVTAHGPNQTKEGCMVDYIYDNELADKMDLIRAKGATVVVMLDTSLAGGFIFDSGKIDSTYSLARGKPSRLVVLAGCQGYPEVSGLFLSDCLSLPGGYLSFTSSFLDAFASSAPGVLNGDLSGDGIVTVEEAFRYTRTKFPDARGQLPVMYDGSSAYGISQELNLKDINGFRPTPDMLELAASGLDGRVYFNFYTNEAGAWWSYWVPLPSGSTGDGIATIASSVSSQVHVVVRGMDQRLYYGRLNASTLEWSGWARLPGSALSAPALAACGFDLYLVVRGVDNRVYVLSSSAGVWNSVWYKIPTGSTIDGPTVACSMASTLHIVVRGEGNTIWHGRLNVAWGGCDREFPRLDESAGRNELET